jgi:predicted small lipoprotein YifL
MPIVRRLPGSAAGRIQGHTCISKVDAEGRLLMKARNLIPLLVCALALSVAACEKKGPLEKAGEKVDHAADTIKNGGSEPMSDKLQDEADKAADKVNEATSK